MYAPRRHLQIPFPVFLANVRQIGFYKTYGRALSKVLLMTFTVYQGLHLLWWSLENKDSQTSKQAEIARLENEVANVSGVKEVPRMSLEEKK
ncbi:hypothetical protein SAICODRAFT_146091 [Saitoella complicata NRRL Y-17804]|uniref:uncharacterized protein n=1 Tax=Saitoella complicata (strain BCRC 22490 / CBS 7301 / JCM 7358 / NBRC 10748 / NRRL Y-17804) TaxID=698492 RepID=UPI00086707E5|nr:uncharacterized protein SAICODRAFT_146091 [Saitoella complicata NRRL Y-17804]ODQ51511.1 hypothetical protein SAICODRAFT_146091 [Saitoella complicata NRRL Y-17804]